MTPKPTAMLFGVLLLATVSRAQPTSIDIAGAPLPIRVLVQSPADTTTDLQVICLFRSSPLNKLHGSLIETNEKLNSLLDRVRDPDRFRGLLGETLVITPPAGRFGARRLLIIGLGDTQSFSPQCMELIGEIVYVEASRLGVAHPFFAPTILDGGVNKFTTGEVAEQVIAGFLRAAALDKLLRDQNASDGKGVVALTYLAGAKNVDSTRAGIEKAVAVASK